MQLLICSPGHRALLHCSGSTHRALLCSGSSFSHPERGAVVVCVRSVNSYPYPPPQPRQPLTHVLCLWMWLFWTFPVSGITHCGLVCPASVMSTVGSRSIHAGPSEPPSFSRPSSRTTSCVCPSSADGHLDCSSLQAVENPAAVNVRVQVSVWTDVCSSLGQTLRSGADGLFEGLQNQISWFAECYSSGHLG